MKAFCGILGLLVVACSPRVTVQVCDNAMFCFHFSQIRECLKLDPDDKKCQPHYKKVKKLVKQINAAQEAKVNGQYDECLNKAKQFMKTEPDEEFYQLKGQSFLCHCHAKVCVTK